MWSCLFDDLHACLRREQQHQDQQQRERKLVSMYQSLVQVSTQSTDQCVGEQRYRAAVRQLNQFSLVRTTHQMQAHNAMLQICCAHIYGEDFLRCRPRLFNRFRIQHFRMATLMLFPRRFGKTTAVALFLATLLDVCRGVKIVIVSPTQDVSNMLLSATRKFFYEIENAKERTITNQSKYFSVAYRGECTQSSKETILSSGRVNSLAARAPTVQGNKGITADVVVMDEASRVDEGFIQEVIAPLLTKDNTSMICISTALGANNHFSKLFQDDGPNTKHFLRFKISLACDACREERIKCVHNTHLMPPWLNPNNHDRAKLFMPDQDLFDQEVMGVIVDSNGEGVFRTALLQQWRERPLLSVPSIIDTVTFVDTYGGGENEMAIVTVTYHSERRCMVVLGIDSFHSQNPEQDAAMLQGYFTALFQHPSQCTYSQNYMAVESNFGGNDMVNLYQQLAAQVCPVRFINDARSLGVRTTQSNKMSAVTIASSNLLDSALYFAQDLICTQGKSAVFQERLLRQLAQIRRTGRHGNSFSGKGSMKKGKVQNDDIAISFLLAIYWHRHQQLAMQVDED
jgi:hypothetical protein